MIRQVIVDGITFPARTAPVEHADTFIVDVATMRVQWLAIVRLRCLDGIVESAKARRALGHLVEHVEAITTCGARFDRCIRRRDPPRLRGFFD